MMQTSLLRAGHRPKAFIGTIVSLAMIVALGTATPVCAALYTATYTGTLTGNAQDVTGLFGAPGSSLSGLDYLAVYLIDDGLADAVPFVGVLDPYSTGSYVQGGSQYNTTALPVSATITINGQTQNFLADTLSLAKEARYNNSDSILHYVDGTRASINLHVSTYPDQPLLTGDFREPLDYTLGATALQNSGGSFSIYQNDPSTYDWAFGNLTISRITIAAVPEPGTRGLLLIGLAMAVILRQARVLRATGTGR